MNLWLLIRYQTPLTLQSPQLSVWERYDLCEENIPYFLNNNQSKDVLFIGKSASILSKVEDTTMETFILKHSASFAKVISDSRLGPELADYLSLLRKDIGALLFKSITADNQISNHLEVASLLISGISFNLPLRFRKFHRSIDRRRDIFKVKVRSIPDPTLYSWHAKDIQNDFQKSIRGITLGPYDKVLF